MSDFLSFENLLTVSRTLPALKQFIEGDVLGKVLSEVGDADFLSYFCQRLMIIFKMFYQRSSDL